MSAFFASFFLERESTLPAVVVGGEEGEGEEKNLKQAPMGMGGGRLNPRSLRSLLELKSGVGHLMDWGTQEPLVCLS